MSTPAGAAPFQPTFGYAFNSGQAKLRVIVVPGSGGPSAQYVTSPDDDLAIEALSCDVDATNANVGVWVSAEVTDGTGLVMAAVRTGQQIGQGVTGEATFGPNLPDSTNFDAAFPVQTVQTSLWEMQPGDGDIVRVTASDPLAIITELRITVDTLSAMTGYIEIPPPTGAYQG